MLVSMQYPSSKRKNPAVLRRVFASERFSLTFSQILRFVRRSPVASRLGCGLPGRKLSRLTPTNVGTLCAFFTARRSRDQIVVVLVLEWVRLFPLNWGKDLGSSQAGV